MYKSCTTERSALQQRQIETCFLSMLQKHPYNEITVSDLCEQAGLSRKTFYRLFGSKDDVLIALIDHTLMDYAKYRLPAEDTSPDAPVEIQKFFSYWKHCRPLLTALDDIHQTSLVTLRAVEHVLREEYGALRWLGALNQSHSEEMVVFYISAIMGLVIRWFESDYKHTVVEMSKILFKLMTTLPINDVKSLSLF